MQIAMIGRGLFVKRIIVRKILKDYDAALINFGLLFYIRLLKCYLNVVAVLIIINAITI